jgi:UDP-GlcNAc:undecaprenyl-phosphate GlcNAc-1-phosphate transferase
MLAFATGAAVTYAVTPLLIGLARRIGFFDHPVGYKKHATPTPYLGGAAVGLGLLAGCIAGSIGLDELDVILALGGCMVAVGTIDDRIGLGIGFRVAAEVFAAWVLFHAGLGWSAFDGDAANLAMTIVFVLGLVNAYNLMDNLDGASPSVALVSSGALGIYAAAAGHPALGAVGVALAGACAGFLPNNLSSPAARIFLGDGGSMLAGFSIAALIMALPEAEGLGWQLVPVTAVLVGLPALDTALVIVSRLRRGVSVLSGGRDHLSHRLLARLGTPRRVAAALAIGQAVCSGAGIAFRQLSPDAAAATAITVLAVALVGVLAHETSRRAPVVDGPPWTPPERGKSPA